MKVIERIPRPEGPKRARPKPKTAAPALGWIGAGITALGIFLLMRPIDDCGSVISPSFHVAELVEAFSGRRGAVRECETALDAATVPAWMFFCLGIALILVAIIVASSNNRRTALVNQNFAPVPALTLAGELQSLAGLLHSGVLTQEEFEAKKAQILARE